MQERQNLRPCIRRLRLPHKRMVHAGRGKQTTDVLPAHVAWQRVRIIAMAVLVTNEFPPPGHGGIDRYMLRLAQALREIGTDVTVVAPAMPSDREFDATQTFEVLRFPYDARRDSISTLVARMAMGTMRAHAARRHDCTIAASWIRSGAACALLPTAVRGRLAIIAHGSEVLSQRSPLKRAVMRAAFGRADVVVANSAFTASILAEAGVGKTPAIARCGVEPTVLRRAPSRCPTILSVGRLVRRKGFDRTIEAVATLRGRFPDVRYEIAGSGPDDAYLRDLVAAHGLQEHVTFLGRVSDDELADAYARAWCFSLPTRRVGADVEGFGIVYLEAAMAGLPAIGGRNCGAEEAIENGRSGLLVDGDDVCSIAAAIEALLSDRERANRMGAYGRMRALKDFTWSAAAQSVMSALAPVVRPSYAVQ